MVDSPVCIGAQELFAKIKFNKHFKNWTGSSNEDSYSRSDYDNKWRHAAKTKYLQFYRCYFQQSTNCEQFVEDF